MRFLMAITVLALTSVGCVRSSTYEALQAKHEAEQARAQGLEQALAAEQEKAQTLAAEVKSLEERIAALSAEKASMMGDQQQMQASIAEMQQALAELEARKRAAEARVAQFKRLIERFKPLMDAGRLRVKIVEGRMVVELATDVLFASGSADLSEEGKAAIAEVSGLLASIPDRRFQVEGHTDNVPIQTRRFPSNWELAAGRAITVVKTMIEAGMPPERVSAASYGEYKPTNGNDSDEGRAANRRIEIVVVPDLSDLPGFDELERMSTPGS